MTDRSVDFVADNAPYRRGESASFPAHRAEVLVGAGVARYADDAAAAVEAATDRPPQAGKRTSQSTRFVKK